MNKLYKGLLGLTVLSLLGAGVHAEGPAVGGYVDFGYQYNINGTGTNNNRIGSNDANSFQIQNAEVNFSGDLAEGTGYHVALHYWEGGSFDTMQEGYIYFPCSWTGGKVMVGKFVTPFGVEVEESMNNANMTYGLAYDYSVPTNHTGVLYTKGLMDDKLGLTLGVVNGWNNTTDTNKGKSGLAKVSYAFSEKVSASLGGIYGPEQSSDSFNYATATATTENLGRSLVDAIVTVKPIDKLTLILNYDWGVEEGVTGFPVGANTTANWQSAGVWGIYDLTDAYSVRARWETLDDDRTSEILQSGTVTLQHKGSNGLITRLEIREDMSTKKTFVDDKGVADDSQSTIGVQMILPFSL